jgi:hypothetical protein
MIKKKIDYHNFELFLNCSEELLEGHGVMSTLAAQT